MQMHNKCRCCLSEGFHKDLDATYTYFDKKEVYSVMLNDCFSITLDTNSLSSKICDVCIEDLRRASNFKKQVLNSEKEFQNITHNVVHKDKKPFKIKLEFEPSNESDASDDYYLADAVQNATLENIKEETECDIREADRKTATRNVQTRSSTPMKWQNLKINSLVNKLSNINSISISRSTDKKLPKKTKKVEIKRKAPSQERSFREPKVSIVWTSSHRSTGIHSASVKAKHRENLVTVLKYSNATPFKSKSLLGFTCVYCEAAYPDPKHLRTHTEEDHSEERLQFKSNFDVSEFNVNVDVSDLICLLCEEKMDNLNTLTEHLVNDHNKTFHKDINDHIVQFKLKMGDVYDCAFCTSTYETFKMLKQHMNKHYGNYTCSKCDSSFTTKRSLSAHSYTHQEGNFKCSHCDKAFSSKPKKWNHEKVIHLGGKNIRNCLYCNESFTSYYQRNQHLIKVHNSEAQYKCNVCNRSFILKSLLMTHIKQNHLMERNCQCTECGYRFFSNKALKAHMVKHTGEKLYTCDVCNKSYARKYTLREHMRIHNNDRRFKCDVCMMTFVQKCSLKSHLLSNHGISMAASDITSLNSALEGR